MNRNENGNGNEGYEFSTYVLTGDRLRKIVDSVKEYKKRECYRAINDFISGNIRDKVFILYGLRRTGKTTLIRQVLLNMPLDRFEKAAFIQIKPGDTLSNVNHDLETLERQGYEYIFIDEVTLIGDFIEGAAVFSDIYASSGMKVVLSGTDSLGFLFAKHEQLYDRCIMLHTTIISYGEFETVLGIKGIDEYIRYGGTMSVSGINYNKGIGSSFSTEEATKEYIDSAIAKNIQHSLKHYQDGAHFRGLYELFKEDELTSAINRVIEDINHRFTKEVLTKAYRSNDLSISARNMLHDRSNPIDLFDNIDDELVNDSIKKMLNILDKDEQKVKIEVEHAYQIKEYLNLLDLVAEVDINYLPNTNKGKKKVIITQPGMRYAQAKSLIGSLMSDKIFNSLSILIKNEVVDRILNEIKGRMMEDIVILETKLTNPRKKIFQLQFAIGEFDMVIQDTDKLTCKIFEIKHSDKAVVSQYRYLTDEEKCKETEHYFGKVVEKNVIYRGNTKKFNGISYINVEEYLKSLKG